MVLHGGRQLVYTEASSVDAEDKLCAPATANFHVAS
jgi:acyl-coenzyme A thioesterase PaaI-like protein